MKKIRAAVIAAALTVTGVVGCEGRADANPPIRGGGRCRVYEQLLQEYVPVVGWDVTRMSRLMWRESRCQPTVQSKTHDSGLLQINRVNYPWLSMKLGRKVTARWLTVPANNVWAAAMLYRYAKRAWGNGYHPWVLR
jgi:hypothetical protein